MQELAELGVGVIAVAAACIIKLSVVLVSLSGAGLSRSAFVSWPALVCVPLALTVILVSSSAVFSFGCSRLGVLVAASPPPLRRTASSVAAPAAVSSSATSGRARLIHRHRVCAATS